MITQTGIEAELLWMVTQDYIRGELVYLVENSVTGERIGMFDWKARAQEFADVKNREEQNDKRGSNQRH